MKGFYYPFSKTGKASILDNPPWNLGGNIIFITFRTDPNKVKEVLPEHLELGEDPGLAFAWFADIISVGENNEELIHTNPARTQYLEGMIAVQCMYKNQQGYTVPYIWVDQDWSIARGWNFGWPKKLANVYMSRINKFNPALSPIGIGSTLSGVVERQGYTVMNGKIRITRKGEPNDIPQFGNLFMNRVVPNVSFGEKPSLQQLLKMEVSNLKIGDVWVGEGELDVFDSENEELANLEPAKIISACYCSVGWTNPGATILEEK